MSVACDIAIEVEDLGKRFRIGPGRPYRALRESLTRAGAALRRGRRSVERPLHGDVIWALRHVSFRVARGEVMGIVGANGAGKSTLLKLLSRITEPTEGRAEIRGRVASLLEVGTGFHPELTGRENVYLNGAILGMRRAEIHAKFDEIVAFSGVERFLDTPVKRYSSGMRVRLAFAVAAHLDPEILIIDEVLAVGDAEFQRKCLGKMSQVAEGGRTVLFVSHNMAAIEGLCTRALLLSSGRLRGDGDVKSVIARYLSTAAEPAEDLDDVLATGLDGALELRSVRLLDPSDRELGMVQSGQAFAIRLELHSLQDVRRATVQIGLNDRLGSRVSVLNSSVAGCELDLPKGPTRIDCQLRDFPLVPGRYSLELKILAAGETLMFARRVAGLLVEGGDFFESGRLPPAGWAGQCFIRHAWSIEGRDCRPAPPATSQPRRLEGRAKR